jgi:hypothetical protein
MKRLIVLNLFAVSVMLMPTSALAAKQYYYIEATAVCSDCGDSTPVPFHTTGKPYSSRTKCQADAKTIIAIGKKNHLKIRARCVVN